MIKRLSHTAVYVLDQARAYDFYINKLGFEVHTDSTMDNGFRWLTVSPKGQPEMEIILMPTATNAMMDAPTRESIQALVAAGKLGAGVFETPDCQATYEELKAKGVEFLQPPAERFYGTEAVFKDDSGNWFSLTSPKAH